MHFNNVDFVYAMGNRDRRMVTAHMYLTLVIAGGVEQTVHIISPEGMANNDNNRKDNDDNDNMRLHSF